MLADLAGWIAPIATIVAAMMTAANLGARITGYGFIVFAVGSAAWIIVALSSGQTNLLVANGFLMLINLIGIWRWLGRQASYDDAAKRVERKSRAATMPDLVPLSSLQAKPVEAASGSRVGQVVDLMAECRSGAISYVVIREGGETRIHDRLHAIPWTSLRIKSDRIELDLSEADLQRLPGIENDAWPAGPIKAPI